MRENYRQPPQRLVHVSALFLVLLFVVLGGWQISRGNFKASLHDAIQPADESNVTGLTLPLDNPAERRYHNVRVYGRYLPEKQFLLDNQIRDRQAGYSVLTPFLVQSANTWVLVDRGWIAQGVERDLFPSVSVDSEPGYITASIYVPYGKPFSLGQIAEGEDYGWPRRIQFVDYIELSNRLGVELQAFTLRLDPQEKSGYRRDWSAHQLPANKHYAYAFQWFAMAIAVAVLWWVYTVKPALRKQ